MENKALKKGMDLIESKIENTLKRLEQIAQPEFIALPAESIKSSLENGFKAIQKTLGIEEEKIELSKETNSQHNKQKVLGKFTRKVAEEKGYTPDF